MYLGIKLLSYETSKGMHDVACYIFENICLAECWNDTSRWLVVKILKPQRTRY